jgi:hypothetical protein
VTITIAIRQIAGPQLRKGSRTNTAHRLANVLSVAHVPSRERELGSMTQAGLSWGDGGS